MTTPIFLRLRMCPYCEMAFVARGKERYCGRLCHTMHWQERSGRRRKRSLAERRQAGRKRQPELDSQNLGG